MPSDTTEVLALDDDLPRLTKGRALTEGSCDFVRDMTEADIELLAHGERITNSAEYAQQSYEADRLSERHKGVARLIASGMNDMSAAAVYGYTATRIGQLRQSPAFEELIASYARDDDVKHAEAQEIAHTLGITAMNLLQEKLERDEAVTETTIREALEVSNSMLDRTGHAPISRSVSATVNAGDLGQRLRAARERAVRSIDVTPTTDEADG